MALLVRNIIMKLMPRLLSGEQIDHGYNCMTLKISVLNNNFQVLHNIISSTSMGYDKYHIDSKTYLCLTISVTCDNQWILHL